MAYKTSDLSEEEKMYICKFADTDGTHFLATGLDRRARDIKEWYDTLRSDERNYYRYLWDMQFKEDYI